MTVWCGSTYSEHRVNACKECKRIYRTHHRRTGPQKTSRSVEAQVRRLNRYRYSAKAISERLKIPHTEVTRILKADLTPLNLTTSLKYAKCQENGGCKPSGVLVNRGYLVPLAECSVCRVPVRPKRLRPTLWKIAA